MEEKKSTLNILIVEDEIILAKDIEYMLANNGYTNAQIATTYRKANELIEKEKPELILCDIHLGNDKDGIDLMGEINKEKHTPFIFITAYSDSETIERAQAISPCAFITKPFTEKQLMATLLRTIVSVFKNDVEKPSDKELQIIKYIAKGESSKLIAEKLNISFNTVETHRRNILKKCMCKNTAELVYLASSKKWI